LAWGKTEPLCLCCCDELCVGWWARCRLATCSYDAHSQPGWGPDSFGWHGDDGFKFCGRPDRGEPYGPAWSSGDVIGCGWHALHRELFYTHNGQLMPTAFRNVPNKECTHTTLTCNAAATNQPTDVMCDV
jgi:hypothetical protein